MECYVMNPSLVTPVRRLEGIAYWVIEDSRGIHDFINTEIRKEWEADAQFECRKPSEDSWLKTLLKRKWRLRVTEINRIEPAPRIMNLVDKKRGYDFVDELNNRVRELQTSIREYSTVIWPLIVREEDFQLVDGYCRYHALRKMNVRRTYTYMGKL
jgi:hypothetical protein